MLFFVLVVRNTSGSSENNGSMWSDCDLMNRSAFLPPQNDEGSVQYQRAVHRRNHLVPVNAGDNGLNRSFIPLEMRGGTDSAEIAFTLSLSGLSTGWACVGDTWQLSPESVEHMRVPRSARSPPSRRPRR